MYRMLSYISFYKNSDSTATTATDVAVNNPEDNTMNTDEVEVKEEEMAVEFNNSSANINFEGCYY